MVLKLLLVLSSVTIQLIRTQETYAKKDVSDVYNVYTTQAFFLQITSDVLDKAYDSGNSVEFIASIVGMPDLPVWINYRHFNGTEKAYLYGSPSANDDGDIEIEVIAINQYNYDTVKDILRLRVIKRERRAKFEVEMKFVNFNIEDMFKNNRFDDVLQIFREKLWRDSNDVYITKIASPLDVGGRLPLDPREKEGVIIRVGSTDNFTRDILDLEREVEVIKNRNPCPRKYKATSAEYMFRNKGFHSDWCSFHLIRHSNDVSTQIPNQKPDTSVSNTARSDLNGYSMPLRQPFPKRDYTVDIMLCFVVPLIIGTMIVSSLTCIFFYNREKSIKGCNETPVQLEQYNSISRATQNLRSLAQNRDQTPLEHYNWTLPRTILKQNRSNSTVPKAVVSSLPVSRTTSFRQMSSGSGFQPVI